jgi:hypothetical protein
VVKESGRFNGQQRVLILAVCVVLVAIGGCARGPDYGPTGTVRGSLLYKGQPLAPGTAVVFKELTVGYACMGQTSPDGTYQLDSWNQGNLPIGRYEVMIQPPEPVDPDSIDPDELINNPGLMESTKVKYDFPRKYSQLATSGLSFEVKEGENEYQIELVD